MKIIFFILIGFFLLIKILMQKNVILNPKVRLGFLKENIF